jgi:ubiquinone/menaquinone biosynthesis C-methylase UbiE
MDKLDIDNIKNFYNEINNIWPTKDKWHTYTKKTIHEFIRVISKKYSLHSNHLKILNAGSAGEEYSVSCTHYHVDIANEKLKNIPNSYITSIENLPFENNFFDICICVGSVINYCDALQTISEFARVLKENGVLILEFESSESFEFLFDIPFGKSAYIIKTFYVDSEQLIWVYSKKYIKNILESFGFSIKIVKEFHIVSALIYRITRNANFSSKFSVLDKILGKTLLRKYACNIILNCVKLP